MSILPRSGEVRLSGPASGKLVSLEYRAPNSAKGSWIDGAGGDSTHLLTRVFQEGIRLARIGGSLHRPNHSSWCPTIREVAPRRRTVQSRKISPARSSPGIPCPGLPPTASFAVASAASSWRVISSIWRGLLRPLRLIPNEHQRAGRQRNPGDRGGVLLSDLL